MTLTLGLDYDDTFTADPALWLEFIILAQSRGHRVVLNTYRDERYDWTEWMDILEEDYDVPVYCTRGVAKGWWMEQFGEPVHIWIDDKPHRINENSSAPAEWLKEWRTTREETVPNRKSA